MSTKEKLIKRLKSKPKDLKFAELKALLEFLGYQLNNSGKTSGSRVSFISQTYEPIKFHKPHPDRLPEYLIKQIIETLEERGQI